MGTTHPYERPSVRTPHISPGILAGRYGLAGLLALATAVGSAGVLGPPALAAPSLGAPAPGVLDMPSAGIASAGSVDGATIGSRPATRDGRVPANIRPSLAAAARDYPKPYFDGCHAEQNAGLIPSTACAYAKVASTTTIALFGDSHALSWFPAVERLALHKGWRLLSLTMSACTPAEIPAYIPKTQTVSTACEEWRREALGLLARVHPAVILVAGTRGFATVDEAGRLLVGSERTAAWEAGAERTVDRLKSAAGRVIWIADTPIARADPPACLARHLRSTLACATPVAYAVNEPWIAEEHFMTQVEDVGFIDPSLWVCPTSPCPAVVGNVQVYRDAGHMTATFMATLAGRLESAVTKDLLAHPPH
jgi:SGNH domain (fused to AT3 domains)